MAVASLLAVLHAELPDSVVVTAAPPLDSQRLADALRTYLDEFGIRVAGRARHRRRRSAHAARRRAPPRRIGAGRRRRARRARDARGDRGRALRSRHRQGAGGGRAATGARRGSLPGAGAEGPGDPARHAFGGPRRSPARIAGRQAAGGERQPRTTSSASPDRSAAERRRWRSPRPATHLALATGYAIVSFPVGGLVLQGVEVNGVVLPRPWLELTLGSAALGSVHAAGGGVDAVMSVIPVSAAALVRLTKQTHGAAVRAERRAGVRLGLAERHQHAAGSSVYARRHRRAGRRGRRAPAGLGDHLDLRAGERARACCSASATTCRARRSSTRRASSCRRSPGLAWRSDEPIFFPNLPRPALHY